MEAFTVLGGVLSVHIRYDNLKPAVKQVLFGRSRLESARWASFKSWYEFSAFYCAPGEDGAHEKGGVEHEGGRFRRKHLVPPPAVDSLAELNERLVAIDIAEDARHIHGRPTSIGFDFEAERDLRRQQRLARFPRPKRWEDFDFEKNPNVTPEFVADLKSPTWVREGRPLVLIGDSGTGKSHLLIGIGTAIAETGLSVRYTTTSALVNELAEADASRRLSSVIARYGKIDLLCLDEFGYLNLDRKGAKLLFQIFTEREERKATAVATNSPFTEWDRTFGDARLCAAIADRITFRCILIQTGTESYRYQATQESLFPTPN